MNSKKKNSSRPNRSCYLCGSTDDLTKDHVPPKNLFVPPLPTNLITVDCCSACHRDLSLDDEAFRAFAASVRDKSPEGRWIWKEKVVQSSFTRSPKFRHAMADLLIQVPMQTASGIVYWEQGIRFPVDRVNMYLIRITKGLLRHFRPAQNYNDLKFDVQHVLRQNPKILDFTLQLLCYDQRGNGVFKFWRGFEEQNEDHSLWIYQFYDALMFSVHAYREWSGILS